MQPLEDVAAPFAAGKQARLKREVQDEMHMHSSDMHVWFSYFVAIHFHHTEIAR